MPNVNAKVAVPKVTASHAAGFDAALDKALAGASRLGKKGTFNVNVEFWAEIKVVNPGTIQQYCVTLSPRD